MELTKNINQKDKEQLGEYSDYPTELFLLLQEIKIYIGEPLYKSYFPDDKEKNVCRNVYTVDVKRGKIKISFKFGDSIFNTQDRKTPTLYDILTCIKSDFLCEQPFKEWCSDLGYDDNSISHKKMWKNCLRQSQKLKAVFKEGEVEWLPN